MLRKQIAFTLAEVLITLTIVGILAVILIPQTVGNLNIEASRIKFRNTYAQLQKGFNIATNLDKVDLMKIEKLEHEDDEDNERTNLDDYVSKYFRGAIVSRNENANTLINVEESVTDQFKTIARTYQLPNGAQLLITQNTIDIMAEDGCTGPVAGSSDSHVCLIYIDINGAKLPNITLGTILAEDSDGEFTGNEETGACLDIAGSEYSVVYDLSASCTLPVDVNYDIYPVMIENNGVRPYNNAVMAALMNTRSSSVSENGPINPNTNEILEEELELDINEERGRTRLQGN